MKKKIIFMGTPDFAVPILEALTESDYEVVLVITQPDRPKGRKRTLTPPPVKVKALEKNIPVFQPESIRKEYETVLQYEADLIVTAAYGQLVPKEILDYPAYGCINVHASLLPELRGGAPIHYAILQGKEETGISIMYMEETLDTGDIIAQEAIPITLTDHVGTLHDKLAKLGAKLLIETLPTIFQKTNKRMKQDEQLATYAPNITREQEKVDWHNTHLEVYNHIRGLHPWPVAYALFNGERMKIWWATLDNKTYRDSEPGEIVAVDEQSFSVACGDQKAVKIVDIQLAGRKRMSVSEFLRGNPELITVGQLLE